MRRWLARMGLVLTLLIAGVYVASGWWWGGGLVKVGGNSFGAFAIGGSLVLYDFGDAAPPMQKSWMVDRFTDSMQWWFATIRTPFVSMAMIPLWAPLLLTAIPTYFLWPRRVRRPGHCRACGYDLKGAPSSTCPECGKGAA